MILEIVFNFNIICSYTYLAIYTYTKYLYVASYEIINIAQTVASSLVTFN